MDENKIEYLKFPENIRARVGMYLGSNQRDGIFSAFREIIDNYYSLMRIGTSSRTKIKSFYISC